MNTIIREDAQTVAQRLEDLYVTAPNAYYYIQGFLHCLVNSPAKRDIAQPDSVPASAPPMDDSAGSNDGAYVQ